MRDKRKKIASKYTDALQHRDDCPRIIGNTGSAKFADYSAHELEGTPKEAVEASFGCGNPVAYSSVKPGDTVLDLGCGAGLDLLIAAEKVGPEGKVIGVDMTDAMLEKARRTIESSGLKNIELRKGFVESLPVEADAVEWVISNCFINLSPDKGKVFAETARVLKPGGCMIVSEIVAQDLPW